MASIDVDDNGEEDEQIPPLGRIFLSTPSYT